MNIIISLVLFIAFVILPNPAAGQSQTPPDLPIDAATRSEVIESLIKELNDGYVFAETAKKMEADLMARSKSKEYD
ncbi:MAG: hypothetical protein ABIU09_05470, partial [Pyrinomonadaceae bacterium]